MTACSALAELRWTGQSVRGQSFALSQRWWHYSVS